MENTMTKAEMMAVIARMSEELAALKAERETSTKSESVPAPAKRGAGKTAETKSPKPKAKKSPKETAPVVLPVRKGKAVGFDGWLNHKVWIHNKPLMESLKGEYDRATRLINFPTAKAATEFCSKFVPKLTDEEYENSRKAIDESFKARAAEKEKSAASKISSKPKAESSAKTSKKSGSLIAKTAKSGKKGADKETAVPVKKPEWRERAGKGEKPFADYSTYKEYWHAVMGK